MDDTSMIQRDARLIILRALHDQTDETLHTNFLDQKLRAFGMNAPVDDATAMRRGALLGALELYLDFINLFLMLLRLFGGNRD